MTARPELPAGLLTLAGPTRRSNRMARSGWTARATSPGAWPGVEERVGRAGDCELFDPAAASAMPHIDLARWCDAVLVAPASGGDAHGMVFVPEMA